MCRRNRIYSLVATQWRHRRHRRRGATHGDSRVRPWIAGSIAVAYLVNLVNLDQNNCFKIMFIPSAIACTPGISQDINIFLL